MEYSEEFQELKKRLTYDAENEMWVDLTVDEIKTVLLETHNLMAELARLQSVEARNDLFEDCLLRALKMWQDKHPEEDGWPDGAVNLAWVLDEYTRLKSVEKAQEWVSVSERLPEQMQDKDYSAEVLGITWKNQQQFVFYDYGTQTWKTNRGAFWEYAHPTHWRPLPPPPTGETK